MIFHRSDSELWFDIVKGKKCTDLNKLSFHRAFQFTEEAVISKTSMIPQVVLTHSRFPVLPRTKQQKTKQTDSGNENTELWLKICFQGRVIPVSSTCQTTQCRLLKQISVMLQWYELFKLRLLLQSPDKLLQQSCCGVWLHSLARNHNYLAIKSETNLVVTASGCIIQ